MRLENDHPSVAGELRNKNETEIPIGEAREPETRGHAMWRCGTCGEMRRLEDDLPEACPECVAPREELYYWEED